MSLVCSLLSHLASCHPHTLLVIPSRSLSSPHTPCYTLTLLVIPSKEGIQALTGLLDYLWFLALTVFFFQVLRLRGNDKRAREWQRE